MQCALALAREGDSIPGKNPIGCVIVRDGKIIGEGCNEVDLRHDAIAHAEIVSMRRAGDILQCGMCTMASIWAKIGRIVFGAGRHDVHAE
jgi:tRNA(adenine34) deaminase